jgi:hypothetical protein
MDPGGVLVYVHRHTAAGTSYLPWWMKWSPTQVLDILPRGVKRNSRDTPSDLTQHLLILYDIYCLML